VRHPQVLLAVRPAAGERYDVVKVAFALFNFLATQVADVSISMEESLGLKYA